MLTLLLAVAGVAVVLGAKDLGERILKAVLGIALIVGVLSCLVQSFATFEVPRMRAISGPGGNVLLLSAVLALALLGFVSWRRRADRERARELWVRRNSAPRKRVLPVPSATSEERRP